MQHDKAAGMTRQLAWMALLLLAAACLEVGGDAIVRAGLRSDGIARGVLFVAGAVVLFAYGVFVNTAPADFGRLLGIYVVLFFIVAQIVNRVVFGIAPSTPILVGGALIVAGGVVMTVWRAS